MVEAWLESSVWSLSSVGGGGGGCGGIRKYSWSLIRHIVKVGTPRNGGSLPAPCMEGGNGERREITFIPNQIELRRRV